MFLTLFHKQCKKISEEIKTVRELLEKKDTADPEEVKKATNALQQSSLKLFEMVYKKMAAERESSSSPSGSTSQSDDSSNTEQKKEEKN